jgi:RND family efflux transporter MFP subunit
MDNDNKQADIASLRIDPKKKSSDRPRSKRWLWALVPVIVVVLIIVYLNFKSSLTPATAVRTGSVTLLAGTDAGAELVATGYVVAQRKAEVASKGTGRLVSLRFDEGDSVKSGDIIAQIDNEDIKAGLDVARAQLEQSKVDTLNAGRQYRRAKQLLASGVTTEVDLENSEMNYNNSLAQVKASEAGVRVQEVNLENTYIRAPFDGTVLTKNADVGEVVAPFASSASSTGSVVTLADMSSLEVEADVSESNIYKVSVGQPCEIVLDAYPSVRYGGRVSKIVPTADRARATVLTKVAFDNKDDRVLPEMSARVSFMTAAGKDTAIPVTALVVPKEALTTRADTRVVFRVDGEFVTAVPVKVGRSLGAQTEILEGLNVGDRVVLTPPGKLETGQKVSVE